MQPRGDRKVIISFRLEHLLGWGVTILLCLVPVYFWLQIHPLSTIHGFPAIMLNLGRVTGLVGMVMYALNLVYATRLRFLERFFGGLNRVYIAHHLLGGFALIFLSFHPLFLALRYVQSSMLQAALVLLPNGLTPLSALFDRANDYHGIVVEQWAVFIGIVAFWGMVGLLLVTFFIRIPYRIWLFTHKFLGLAFFLGGIHILLVTSDTSRNGPLRYYLLAITIIGLAAFAYRTLVGNILIRKYAYTVEAVTQDGGNVTQVLLKPTQRGINFKPGQFVFIRFLDNSSKVLTREWHPFSISSAPDDPYLRLSVKALGDYTNILHSITKGTRAEIEGAYGRFSYYHFNNKKQIWVGGGIGVTPFISMARSLPEGDYEIDLYYAVKTRSELINWNELEGIAKLRSGKFRVIPFVGEEQKGHLDADFIEKNSNGVAGKEVFICGPPGLMTSIRKQLRAKGLPGTSIHSEEFAMS